MLINQSSTEICKTNKIKEPGKSIIKLFCEGQNGSVSYAGQCKLYKMLASASLPENDQTGSV